MLTRKYKFRTNRWAGVSALLVLATASVGFVLAGCGPEPTPSSVEVNTGPHVPLYRFTKELPVETKARLGTEYRTILTVPNQFQDDEGLPAANYVSETVRVPQKALLDFGIGMVLVDGVAGEQISFSVSVQSGDSTHEIYSRDLDTVDFKEPLESEWVDEQLDLSRWAGEEVRFIFRAIADGSEYPGARWAAPILYPASGRSAETPPNVLIISLDTLRADHLGSYGYARDTSPNLDQLAAESFLFEECIAPSSWTTPSHATLFTGLAPALHGAGSFPGYRLRQSFTTLSELARDAGYFTAAFTEGVAVAGQFGFYQGFDLYSNGRESKRSIAGAPQGEAEETFGRALNWMERYQKQPFMMFLHTYEIHWPYKPPAKFANKFTSSPIDTNKFIDDLSANGFSGEGFLVMTSDPEKREIVKDLYDGGIAYTDAVLGNLVDQIKQWGLLENTVVIILSDHGEGFWEHGLASHGMSLYREMLHVPLIIRLPGQTPPSGRVSTIVSLADVFPTAVEWLGVDYSVGGDAFSLSPLMKNAASLYSRQSVTSHLVQQIPNWLMMSVEDSGGKYIVTTHYQNVESPLHGYEVPPAGFEPGVPETALTSHLLSGGRDWWTAATEEARLPMLNSAREEFFLYPGDRMEQADLSLQDLESIKRYRELLATEANKWKAQGANLTFDEPIAPLSEEEQHELRAMGYLD